MSAALLASAILSPGARVTKVSQMRTVFSESIVNAIVRDLCNRSGLREEWDHLDMAAKERLVDDWRAIVDLYLIGTLGP